MRKINLLFIFFLSLCSLYAQKRNINDAMRVAEKHFTKSPGSKSRIAPGSIKLVATSDDFIIDSKTKSTSLDRAFYIYNHGSSSFVVVSGDERMPEVLGYSDTGIFELDNMPENMKEWFSYYVDLYNELETNNIPQKNYMTSVTNFAENIEPLLGNIMFDQVSPYNLMCPKYDGEYTLAGCVAVTLAEIMAYHKFPEKGIGNKSYTTEKHKYNVSYDFEKNPFDWNNVLGTYEKGHSYTQEQVNAIKNLVYACGIAVEMDYDPEFSGAGMVDAINGLVEHLGYTPNIHAVNRCNYLSSEWINMMKSELNNKCPIFYSGLSKSAGHAFVIDGYDKNDMFHVNWGWNGMNNGYFEIFSLSPQSTGSGGGTDVNGYKYNQGMIVGLKPVRDTRTDSYFEFASLSFSKTEFEKGTSFDVFVNRIFNWGYNFDGSVGVFVEKNGESIKIGETISGGIVKTGYGYNSIEVGGTVPTSLSDGEYSIIIKSQYKDSDKWCRATGNLGTESEFIMKIEGNTCTIYPDASKSANLECEMTLLHDLYYGHLTDADIKVKNNSSFPYYGNIGLGIYEKNGNSYNVISYLKGEQYELAPGEEAVGRTSGYFAYNNQYLPAGEYYIAPTIYSNPSFILAEPVQVEVKTPTGNATIKLGTPHLDKTIYKHGEKINFSIDLSISGGSVYQGYYTFAFFQNNQNVHQLSSKSLVVGENKTFNLIDSIDVPTLSPGLYNMGFYVRRHNQYNWEKSISCGNISIVPNTSGIDEEEINLPYVMSTSDESNLRIDSNVGINKVSIYSVSGQLLRTATFAGETNTVIPADNIRSGVYLLEVITSDGNRHVFKTVRD